MDRKPLAILILPYFRVDRDALQQSILILEPFVDRFIIVKDERNSFDVKNFLQETNFEVSIDWLSAYSIDVCHRWFLGFEYARQKFDFARAFIFPCDLTLDTLAQIKSRLPDFLQSQTDLTLGDYESSDPIKTAINQEYVLPVIKLLFDVNISKKFEQLVSPRTEFVMLKRDFYRQFLKHGDWWPFEVTLSLILSALNHNQDINIKWLGNITDNSISRRRNRAFYQVFRSTLVLKAEALWYDQGRTMERWTEHNSKIVTLQNELLRKIKELSKSN
jgi:hypothetical protein